MATNEELLLKADVLAMDDARYKEILIQQGKYDESVKVPQFGYEEYTEEKLKLRQDMAFGKVRWYGDYKKDLWLYLANNNPIFATCFSHPLHPISRIERYYLYSTIIIFKITVSILVTQAKTCMDKGNLTCEIDQGKKNVTGANSEFLDLCCTCSRVGILSVFDAVGPSIGTTLVAFLGGVIYAVTMFQFVACSCAQRFENDNRRHALEHKGYAVIAVVTVIVIIMAYDPFQYCINNGLLSTAFTTFLKAQAMSWIGATFFVPGICCFTLLNHKETAKEEKGQVNWHVTWQQQQESP